MNQCKGHLEVHLKVVFCVMQMKIQKDRKVIEQAKREGEREGEGEGGRHIVFSGFTLEQSLRED